MRRYRFLLSLVILLLALGSSCNKKDNCNDSCLNGTCAGSTCVCDTNYTGKWCQTYTGSTGSSSSSGGSSTGSSSSGSSTSSGGSGNGGPGFKLLFWKDFDGPPVTVSLWSTDPGRQITKHYAAEPACDADGCVTYHWSYIRSQIDYTATDGIRTWTGKADYTGPCSAVKLEQ